MIDLYRLWVVKDGKKGREEKGKLHWGPGYMLYLKVGKV